MDLLLELLLELLLVLLLLLLLYVLYPVHLWGARSAPPRLPFEGSHTGFRSGARHADPGGAAFRSLKRPAAFDWLKNMRSAGCFVLWLRFCSNLAVRPRFCSLGQSPGTDLPCLTDRFAASHAARAHATPTSSNSVKTPLKLSRNACRPVCAKRRGR